MPTVLEETDVSLDRADLLSRSPIHKPINKKGRVQEPSRAAGMHLSGVLRYVALTSGLMKAVDDIDEEGLPLRMALGLAWEEFAVSLYPDVHWQPGECIEGGIAMNCDGHSVRIGENGNKLQLEEFKLTWKKAKSAEELLHEWYWMHQGRGYCWGYGANFMRWHVCYVNGDYRGSGPLYKRYLVYFSDADVESTRKLVVKHSGAAAEQGHGE